jgi:hypothetical protein
VIPSEMRCFSGRANGDGAKMRRWRIPAPLGPPQRLQSAAVLGTLVGCALLLSSPSRAFEQSAASPTGSAMDVIAKIVHRHDRLESSTCLLSVRFRKSSFPYLSLTISGTAYFGKASRFAAIFTNVPSILRGFPPAYEAMMNVGRWNRGFRITLDPPQVIAGRTLVVLHLTARDASSSLQYGHAVVDPATWTIVAMDWHSRDMQFDITQSFTALGPFRVLAGQRATIHVPVARAGATTTFRNYRTNVAVSPDVFADPH